MVQISFCFMLMVLIYWEKADVSLTVNRRWYVEIKRPTRYNRLVSYCKTYCSLNMFRHHYAHHQELKSYTDGCCLWYFVLWFTGRWSGVELWVMCPVCGVFLEKHPANRTHNPQLNTRPTTCKPKHQVTQAATICIRLELLMMGIMVSGTCWANSKFCNKEINLLYLVGLLISTYIGRNVILFFSICY